MQAVFDTNVLVSALFWHGAPHALLEQVRNGSITLITSPALLAELADVIGRAKFDAILTRSNTSRERALAQVRRLAEVFDPPVRQYDGARTDLLEPRDHPQCRGLATSGGTEQRDDLATVDIHAERFHRMDG